MKFFYPQGRAWKKGARRWSILVRGAKRRGESSQQERDFDSSRYVETLQEC